MERLIIILPKDTEILRGQSGDSEHFLSRPGTSVSIHPITEQNLNNDLLAVGLIEDGKELKGEKFCLPIVAKYREQLKEAMTDFENGRFLSNKQKLELLAKIESYILGSEVVGPDSLKPF